LVGVSRDATFGPVLTVALGGIWANLLGDRSVRLLPLCEAEIHAMFAELKSAPLLFGGRGHASPAVDLAAVVRAVAAVARAAIALGPRLGAVEVNPLLVGRHGVEALDALVVCEPEARET